MNDKIVYSYIDEIGKRLGDPSLYGAASLMVGAGFSKNADCIGDKTNMPPDWSKLSETMYETLYPSEKDNEIRKAKECFGKNALILAQKYEVTFDRQSLNSLIERSIADKNYVPGELHRKLIELNWNDVFTTNYDTLLERAIEQIVARKNYKIVYSQDDLPGSVRPRLVKLHGSIGRSSQYIITEEDYRTYPDKYAPFVNTVQQSMLETQLCLIGFSGTDPNFLNWLGWLRDNMEENCPKMYLCGLFDNLGTAERNILERKRITILDLSVLIEGIKENRHYMAIKKFIELLKQKSEKKKEDILSEKPYENFREFDNKLGWNMNQYAKSMMNVVNHLIEKLDDYICLPENEADDIGKYIDKQLRFILDKDFFEQKYIVINSYCRILKKCNRPLYDHVAEKLRAIVDDTSVDENMKSDIILYLLQMYRLDGEFDDYLKIKNSIKASIFDGTRKKNEYWIECTKYHMCILDMNEAYESLNKIQISSYGEYALKKASLLNQLNKKNEAKELITSTIAFVSQQRYSENRNASLIGYANLVARASWTIFDGQELFSDSLYEDNPFNCRKVVIESRESIIETIFENQRPQNCKINSFNPNAYTITYTMGSPKELKKMEESFKYLLLQDLLCIGVYRDHKNATNAAIKNIDNTSSSPLWRWYKILSTNDNHICNMYFTRERIYNAGLEFVQKFYGQLISLLEISMGDNKSKEETFVDCKILTDIASKITIVLDEDRIVKLINIFIRIDESLSDEDEKEAIIGNALNIIRYSFLLKILNECIGDLLDNKLIDYRFTSFFNDVDCILEEVEEQQFKEKLINSIKIELDSNDSKIRDNAINKFKLFEKLIIDSVCYEQILAKVWNQVDDFGLPLNNTYLPIAWIDDIKHKAEEKTIAYLLNPQISNNYQDGIILGGKTADDQVLGYLTVLYQMLQNKNNCIFSKGQLCSIIEYFYNYVGNERNILDRSYDIMGLISQTRECLKKINDIILLLCINVKVSNLYEGALEKIIDAFLTQMDEIGIAAHSVKLILEDFDVKEIFAEFEKKILCGDEKEISDAFIMLHGSIQILQSHDKETDMEELIIQFIQRVQYLEIRIGKRIILELHGILRRKVFLNEENRAHVINMLKTCYDIFKNAKEERIKDGLDGMYNVSNLAKDYYECLKENDIEVGSIFEVLIDNFKACKLNEIKFKWL